jgi:AcrR family transcriptional regulator
MRKGEATRQAILERAVELASEVGLEKLSIGRLATALEMSKSGLFAHFNSKESLQIQTLEHAAEQFVDGVVRPALARPRGLPRVRALFETWMTWARSAPRQGCVFVAAATEFDDQPGSVRERLVQSQKDWLDVIANCFRTGIDEGHFRPDADPYQFAQDLHGVMLAFHHAARLMKDPAAEDRARRGFETLLSAVAQPTPEPTPT